MGRQCLVLLSTVLAASAGSGLTTWPGAWWLSSGIFPTLNPGSRPPSTRRGATLDYGDDGLRYWTVWHRSRRVAGLDHGKLGRVDWRERRLPGQHPCHLVRGKVADRSDRLFGVVRRVWCDDHIVQTEERVHWPPVPLLGWFLLDVVQAGAGDPALIEGQVPGPVR